ncbi:MAG: UDP-N-acetylmuramyl pentapeptide phosphotransferase [Brevibacillus sp.]|nr:UDP-N-acetylmuramyl pentapeptide phosphotransferase [Brevibacillus sp.]
MESKWLIASAIGLGIPVLVHRSLLSFVLKKLRARGMHRVNYRGLEVMTAGGVMLVSSSVIALLGMLVYVGTMTTEISAWKEGMLLGAGMIAVAFWGWQDDCASDQQTKGFRGHFGMLWREKRMTSGIWKVWGGGSTAVVIALALGPSSLWTWIIAASLLAISPNVLNLFDLRPARAMKVFWLLLIAAMVIGYCSEGLESSYRHGLWQLPVMMATCLLFRHDAGGRIMLGDTGANALGFCAGYLFVLGTPLLAQVVILLLFICLHILAEFISISTMIERFRWLKRIDRWGRSAEPE